MVNKMLWGLTAIRKESMLHTAEIGYISGNQRF
jgi:hypothetical protein